MGIKDLFKVIEDECPEQLQTIPLTNLSGYRIAVDVSIYLYKYIRACGEKAWISAFITFLITMKESGATLVLVADGPNTPPEKKLEQESRRAQTERSVNRMKECERLRKLIRDEYCETERAIDGQLRKECEILIAAEKSQKGITVNYSDPFDVIQWLDVTGDRLKKQTMPITERHRQIAEDLFRMLGFAYIKADGEAEALCAYLAVDGQVDGVATEDTDVLAYGCPYMFCFKDLKLSAKQIHVLHLPSILGSMRLQYEEWRDLCILLECDYNARVVGFPPDGRQRKKAVGIGYKGAVAMINEYRRLEVVCQHVIDEGPLNYRRCRELFTVPGTIPIVHPYQRPANVDEIEAFFKEHNVGISIDYVLNAWKPPAMEFT